MPSRSPPLKPAMLSVAAPQVHHDEDLRSDHVRALYGSYLPLPSRSTQPHPKDGRQRQQRSVRGARQLSSFRPLRRPRSRPISSLLQRASPGHGGFAGEDQPARAQRHDRRCLHAGRDPRRRQDVEHRTARRHCRHDPGPLLRHHLSGRIRTARSTASSTRPPWAACPTSGSWPRRPRSTAHTTRHSSLPATAPFASLTRRQDSARAEGRAGDIFRACQTKDSPSRIG